MASQSEAFCHWRAGCWTWQQALPHTGRDRANAPGVKGSGGDPQSQEGCVDPTDPGEAGGLLAYCLVSLTGMMIGLGGSCSSLYP